MKFIVSAAIVVLLALCAFTQSPSKVLKQAEKALGGPKAVQGVHSVVRTGHITRLSDGDEGTYVSETSQPTMFHVRTNIGGFETEVGYNGRSAWLEASLADRIKFGAGLLANFNKGATFTLEKERLNDEIWLPSQVDINFSARVMLFKGIELNQVQKFYDYKKFETEVKDAKAREEKVP